MRRTDFDVFLKNALTKTMRIAAGSLAEAISLAERDGHKVDYLKQLQSEYLVLRDTAKPEDCPRWEAVLRQLRDCKCRTCGKKYDNTKARGDYTGFCSAKCQHAKAKQLGHKRGTREGDVLSKAGEIGDVPWTPHRDFLLRGLKKPQEQKEPHEQKVSMSRAAADDLCREFTTDQLIELQRELDEGSDELFETLTEECAKRRPDLYVQESSTQK